MRLEFTRDTIQAGLQVSAGCSLSKVSFGIHDLNQQCLRILRCTAQALANSPGGLRFKADTRPWLEGLAVVRPALPASSGRLFKPGLPVRGVGA
ncbi:MAG: hypothetical protein V4772_11265 [Pseudomonadota bacterium]